MRLLFAGTPTAALPSLAALTASRHEVVAVLTRPAAPAGRGRSPRPGPVAEAATRAGIEVLTPRRPGEPAFLDRLAALAPDCCPVVAYGALVPPAALDVPPAGWVNLHLSLLPAWRGATPVQHAVLAGDEVTGATTFRLEAGLDTGPVYGVVTEPVRPSDTSGALLVRLAESGARLLVATLDGIESGTLTAVPQPADGVSYAPKLTVADVRVDWAAPAVRVDRLVRAATPVPGAWTTFRGSRLGLGPVTPPAGPAAAGAAPVAGPALAPGRITVESTGRGAAAVLTGTATGVVRLGTVRPAGRREMPAADWARGVRPAPGEGFE